MNPKKIFILLVDDDREDQDLFADAIAGLEMSIELKILSNGVELMDFLYHTEILPDMIFLDLHMPMMTGEECLTDIRNETEFNNIPILIYSSYYDLEQVERLFENGANRYLQKPRSFSDLVTSLRRAIDSIVQNGPGGNSIIYIAS